MKPTWRSAGDPSRLNRVASRRSSLRFSRNTPRIPPSRALSAGRLAGLGAHVGSTTGCSPRRCAPLSVAFRSEYTRYSSLTRLVSRAPRRPRRSRGFHHRLFTASLRAAQRCVSVGIHQVFLPHAPCQPGASPASALAWVPPPAEPRRFTPLIVAFQSKYTPYSSLARLVSRASHRPRRSPGFHRRPLATRHAAGCRWRTGPEVAIIRRPACGAEVFHR